MFLLHTKHALVIVGLLALSSTAANAQQVDSRPSGAFGFDLVGALPVSDYAKTTGFGLGGLFAVEKRLNKDLTLTVRAGGIYHFEKIGFSFLQIPIIGGLKVTSDSGKFYIRGEFGVSIGKTFGAGPDLGDLGDFGDAEESESSTDITPMAGVGIGFWISPKWAMMFDAYAASVTEIEESIYLTGGFGYRFAYF